MLNEIINKVAEKAGISSETATTAVTTVLDFIKNKVPGIGSQIDSFLHGGITGSVSDAMGHAKDSASSVLDSAKEKLGSIFNKK